MKGFSIRTGSLIWDINTCEVYNNSWSGAKPEGKVGTGVLYHRQSGQQSGRHGDLGSRHQAGLPRGRTITVREERG